jgi:hypothetical protein
MAKLASMIDPEKRMRSRSIDAAFVTCVAAAVGFTCGGDGDGRDSAGGPGLASLDGSVSATDGDGDGTAEDDGPTGGDGDGDGDGDGTVDDGPGAIPTKWDLGTFPDVEIELEQGCSKVDFLFVVDNSGSMGDDQVNLVNNFPNFINGIQTTLENVDEYQVGVVTTDAYAGNSNGCNQLGALVTRTGGSQSSNMTCGPYANGMNFMTEQDNLAMEFACAAQVGSDGNGIEMGMNAMEIAVRGDLGGVGQCNEGYIREDALLVVVIITDEWDGPGDPDILGSSGNAGTWYDTIVTAKGGIPENIVVLSLIHFPGCEPTDGFYSGDIQPFTAMFGPNGFIGCIAGDYGMIFNEAVGIIDTACDNFIPPG